MTTPAAGVEWRSILSQMWYSLLYATLPDDETARWLAEQMISGRNFPSGPEVYYWALSQAVVAEQVTEPGVFVKARHGTDPEHAPEAEHDPEAIRALCVRILHYLDAARPWPPQRPAPDREESS